MNKTRFCNTTNKNMADYAIDNLPAYLQDSQLVKDCKEMHTTIIFCPYEIPPTNEIKTLDDFKKLYFVADYFISNIQHYSFISFINGKTRQRVQLLEFLDNVDVKIENFDDIYQCLNFNLFIHIENTRTTTCDLCKKMIYVYDDIMILPCQHNLCRLCFTIKHANKKSLKCEICNNPIFIKRHKFIAKGCETHV